MTATTPETPVAEIPGLAAAVKYATDCTTHVAAINTGIDGATAQLRAAEVTDPEVYAAFAAAADAMASGIAAFGRAKVALAKQNVVKEGYEAAPGAGSKQFVTAG